MKPLIQAAEELSATMKLLHHRGWFDGTGGNFSVVVSHDPLRLLMAPSGVDKGSVQPEELIEVNSSGDVIKGVTTHDTSVNVPIIANSQDLQTLSESAAVRLSEAPHGLLVSGHGLYAWGDDLKEARRHTEIIEFLLELTWRQSLHRSHK